MTSCFLAENEQTSELWYWRHKQAKKKTKRIMSPWLQKQLPANPFMQLPIILTTLLIIIFHWRETLPLFCSFYFRLSRKKKEREKAFRGSLLVSSKVEFLFKRQLSPKTGSDAGFYCLPCSKQIWRTLISVLGPGRLVILVILLSQVAPLLFGAKVN